MFFFNPYIRSFGVMTADYKSFDDSLSYEEINNIVCDGFRNAMKKYCAEKQQEYPVEFDSNHNIIILWHNSPNKDSCKFSVNRTLEQLVKAPFQGTVYFRSMRSILDEVGMEGLVRTISILAKHERQYVFFDNDYFSYDGIIGKIDMANISEKAMQIATSIATQAAVGNVFVELAALLPQENEDGFLDFYWKWQKTEVPVDACNQDLGITHRTFYKNAQAYEKTYYYCEHLKIFFWQISTQPKRGPLPDKEEYLHDMTLMENGQVSEADICKKYGFHSVIDCPRIRLALTSPKKRKRSK